MTEDNPNNILRCLSDSEEIELGGCKRYHLLGTDLFLIKQLNFELVIDTDMLSLRYEWSWHQRKEIDGTTIYHFVSNVGDFFEHEDCPLQLLFCVNIIRDLMK